MCVSIDHQSSQSPLSLSSSLSCAHYGDSLTCIVTTNKGAPQPKKRVVCLFVSVCDRFRSVSSKKKTKHKKKMSRSLFSILMRQYFASCFFSLLLLLLNEFLPLKCLPSPFSLSQCSIFVFADLSTVILSLH